MIFPWLTFPRNDGALKDLVSELCASDELQYPSRHGTTKPFVDDKVYTRMRQFRTALSWKLDDETTTGLLPVHGALDAVTEELLLRSFVTRIEDGSWLVPEAPGQRPKTVPRAATSQTATASGRARSLASKPDECVRLLSNIRQLLEQNGQPPGRLSHTRGRSFRWDAKRRPCLYALHWRPDEPYHESNGATIKVQPNGEVYLCCLHSTCRSHGAGDGEFVGVVFEATDMNLVDVSEPAASAG